MLKRSKAISVVFTGIITITAEVLLVLWTEGLIMASSAPSAGLETSLPWILLGVAVSAVIAIVGPRHERIWLIVLLFVIVTLLGSFFIGQLALFQLEYQRDYTLNRAPIIRLRGPNQILGTPGTKEPAEHWAPTQS